VRRGGERGQAIVELALALPVFLALTVGLVDLGRAVYVRNALGNAARDAARFASVDPANAACVKAVAGFRDSLAELSPADVAYAAPAAPAINQPVSVTVRTTYRPLTPLVAELLGQESLRLSASTTVRVRNVPSAPLACPPPAEPSPTPTGVPAAPSATPSPAGGTPTAVPTAAAVPPTPTAAPPTGTPVPPTATPRPPTATPVPPTATPVPPTATPTPCTLAPGQCKKLP
jgi:Flp pilus assembly protein TadG